MIDRIYPMLTAQPFHQATIDHRTEHCLNFNVFASISCERLQFLLDGIQTEFTLVQQQ